MDPLVLFKQQEVLQYILARDMLHFLLCVACELKNQSDEAETTSVCLPE